MYRSFRVPACSLRFGTFTSECYSKPKVNIKSPTRSTRAPSTWRYTRQCSLRVGCIHGITRTRQAATTKKNTRKPPKVRILARIPPVKIIILPQKLFSSKCEVLCKGKIRLGFDIVYCKVKGKGYGKVALPSLPKPKNRTSVFAKRVIEVQIVERPMGKCGGIASEKYDEGTIKCMQCEGYKTSMSGKKDRVMHSGVIVKTEDGSKYLIHKGKKFGSKGHRTIIEKPNYAMYYKGYRNVNDPIKPKKLRKVEDYFKASGNGYNIKNDNCHDGTTRMINLAKKP